MTRYAYDAERHTLVAAWPTGAGDRAITVTSMHATVIEDVAGRLADRLTQLSRALWRTYTHPASNADDDLPPNTEGERRQENRDALAEVPVALRAPNLPQNGMLLLSHNPVGETAHRVGRALHEISLPAVTDTVVADVETEIDAVERAVRGDLTGRAAQAVVLTRADAPPIHVAAADALFDADPFATPALFREIEPTAAAVAAAHWLAAAATVAAGASGEDPETVVETADNIEAIPTETPTEVLTRISEGEDPLEVVLDMIRAAMAVANREIPDITDFAEMLEQAEELTVRHDLELSETGIRLVPLDLFRPAPDMLEDLVTGIHGCYLIWDECAPGDDNEGDADEEGTGAAITARQERRQAEFAGAVRTVARAERSRIGL
jgi:hypothetical protein